MEIETTPVTADALLSLLAVKAGDTLTIDALKRTEEHLARDPRFANVQVFAADREGGGVDLLFRLTPVHPIDDISFTGESGLDPAELGRRVRAQYGGIPTGTRPSDVEESVVRILAGEGYRSARVASHTEETHNPDRATLVFDVAAGPRTMIRNVRVTGTSKLHRCDDPCPQRCAARHSLPRARDSRRRCRRFATSCATPATTRRSPPTRRLPTAPTSISKFASMPDRTSR
jgi:outer membrane protein assembly factor BamA